MKTYRLSEIPLLRLLQHSNCTLNTSIEFRKALLIVLYRWQIGLPADSLEQAFGCVAAGLDLKRQWLWRANVSELFLTRSHSRRSWKAENRGDLVTYQHVRSDAPLNEFTGINAIVLAVLLAFFEERELGFEGAGQDGDSEVVEVERHLDRTCLRGCLKGKDSLACVGSSRCRERGFRLRALRK